MGSARSFLTGTAAGAGVMYFFDPRMGNRRRAFFEDQLRRLSREIACGCDAGFRDFGNRAQGAMHDVGALVQQGQLPMTHRRKRTGWSPGARLVAAACGTALMANCLARRTPRAMLLGTLGFGLFARALDSEPGGIHIHRTIEIDVPVGRVYEFFSHPENYPRISDTIVNVETFGDGRFAKDMLIAGMPVRFCERFFRCEENHVLESRSEPGSSLRYSKAMLFEDAGGATTRLHVHFSYHPLGGAMTHAIASLLGIDPKTILNDLLMRAKYYLETGREPHDAACHRQSNSNPRRQRSDPQLAHQFGNSSLHGPGAPMDDLRQPGLSEYTTRSPWPSSAEAHVSHEHGAQFPTPMD